MLEISTYTSPFLSCQIWAVPIGAPLTLYMIAFAAETEFCIRWADEQAPQSAKIAAMLNSRDLLGTFIFHSGVKVLQGEPLQRIDRGSAAAGELPRMRKFPSLRPDISRIVRYGCIPGRG